MKAQTLPQQIAAEIVCHLDTIGTSYMQVGTLLVEGRECFDKQPEFVEWCKVEFGISKSQAFNLMKVSTVFKDDARFKVVAMRALLALTQVAEVPGLLDKAAELAAEGKLDTRAVAALVEPVKTPKAAPVQPESVKTEAAILAPAASADDVAPWETPERDMETGEDLPVQVVQVRDETIITVNEVAVAAPGNEEVAALLRTIKSLEDTIRGMREQAAVQRSEREAKKYSAPMLPQFKSKCMYARLGLSAEEATKKAAINKAKRELVKLGYGEGHDAWGKIAEAVEQLLSVAE